MGLSMLFGLVITNVAVAIGGVLLFTLVLFQVAMGMRWIKLGKHHRVWHRRTAFAIVAVAALHAVIGMTYAFGLRLG